MRPLVPPVLLALLLSALLSGCVVEETPQDAPTDADGEGAQAQTEPQAQADPEPAQEDEATAPHGEPQVTEGAVESGTDTQQVPGAWACKTVTITNDFGGASLGVLSTGVAAGGISVKSEQRDGYLVEALFESRAGSEAEARDVVERSSVDHTDVLDGATLTLRTFPKLEPATAPIVPMPPLPITLDLAHVSLSVHFVITVPLGPAIDLTADSASGDISVQDLAGPRLGVASASGDLLLSLLAMDETVVDTASGDVLVDGLTGLRLDASSSSGDLVAKQLALGTVSVSTASGDVVLKGAIDELDAGTSSGDLIVQATPAASGAFELSTASGDVDLELTGDGRAYAVDASSASGDIDVEVPDGEVIEDEERHVEVASPGYDDAELRTSVTVGTSSGDISVQAS